MAVSSAAVRLVPGEAAKTAFTIVFGEPAKRAFGGGGAGVDIGEIKLRDVRRRRDPASLLSYLVNQWAPRSTR